MLPKLNKKDTPKGWVLEEGHFSKVFVKKPYIISGRIWQEETGIWRAKFELSGNQSFEVWSSAQVFSPDQKTLTGALGWVKRNSARIQKRVKKAIAGDKKREAADEKKRKRGKFEELGCGCP